MPPHFFFFFLAGGTQKFIFTTIYLATPILVCKPNFRPLQPFLLGNLVEQPRTSITDRQTHRVTYGGGTHLKIKSRQRRAILITLERKKIRHFRQYFHIIPASALEGDKWISKQEIQILIHKVIIMSPIDMIYQVFGQKVR